MQFENVTTSLAAVRELLERDGQKDDADKLYGLEVYNSASAQVAVETLNSIDPKTNDARDALAWASSVCIGACVARHSLFAVAA